MSQWQCEHGVWHSDHDRVSACPACSSGFSRIFSRARQSAWSLPDLVQRVGRDKKYRRIEWRVPGEYAWVHEADNRIYRYTLLHAFGRLTADDMLASDWEEWTEPQEQTTDQEEGNDA